ncbi:MAG: GNAT family N-acetyltransferase [Firmicutes bacterium]|nr:GNAT family N-acetyltransferase [Bacillota bacterium]
MKIKDLSKTFYVRKLDKDDIELIYDLSCKNHIYYQYHPPFVTRESILDDMKALPPGKSYDDKYYIGFFENDSLVAIMDLILDYPTKGIAFIGLFMTNIQYQHKGIGSNIISEITMSLKSLGYRKIRLGVDKGNPQSYSFWSKNNFNVISEDKYILMELDIV